MKIALLACCERGTLEAETLLMVESLRTFGGRFSDTDVHTFQPRPGTDIALATRARLEALGVRHHVDPLNAEHADYPFANKPAVCAWAEAHLDADVLVFNDSDTLILNPPEAFALPEDVDCRLRPEWNRGNGNGATLGEGDPVDPYWLELYERFGVTERPFVTATVTGERVRGYFNSGLVAVRRKAGLSAQWWSTLRDMLREGRIPPTGGPYFMEQFALALTVSRHWQRTDLFDARYNHPLTARWRMSPEAAALRPSDLVHLHVFASSRFPVDRLRPPLPADDPRTAWIRERWPINTEARGPSSTPPVFDPRFKVTSTRSLRRKLRGLRPRSGARAVVIAPGDGVDAFPVKPLVLRDWQLLLVEPRRFVFERVEANLRWCPGVHRVHGAWSADEGTVRIHVLRRGHLVPTEWGRPVAATRSLLEGWREVAGPDGLDWRVEQEDVPGWRFDPDGPRADVLLVNQTGSEWDLLEQMWLAGHRPRVIALHRWRFAGDDAELCRKWLTHRRYRVEVSEQEVLAVRRSGWWRWRDS